jgi:hypothetical protein
MDVYIKNDPCNAKLFFTNITKFNTKAEIWGIGFIEIWGCVMGEFWIEEVGLNQIKYLSILGINNIK